MRTCSLLSTSKKLKFKCLEPWSVECLHEADLPKGVFNIVNG